MRSMLAATAVGTHLLLAYKWCKRFIAAWLVLDA